MNGKDILTFLKRKINMKKTHLRKLIRPFINFFARDIDIKYQLLGSDYGAWPLPDEFIGKELNLLTLGVGEDMSYEIEAGNLCDMKLTCLDPTARSHKYIKKNFSKLNSPLFYQKAAIGNSTQPIFELPKNPSHVSLYKRDTGKIADQVNSLNINELNQLIN